MAIQKIGFMTPGDMGQAVAMQLKQKGFTVCTALDARSERSRTLAREAGLTDLGTITKLTAECDFIMSVMNPGAALDFAKEAATAIRANRKPVTFVDCNAVSPDTAHMIDKLIREAGGRFVDGGIIGPPPRGKAKTSLYLSGPDAAEFEPQLATPQMAVKTVTNRVGDASALKMCYAALNKGTQALWMEVLVAAQRLGVAGHLEEQLMSSRKDLLEWALSALPSTPPKAYRWVPEMLQIAQTLESTGQTPKVFQGAADIYQFLAGTTLARETPETRDKSRTGKDVVRMLAEDKGAK